MKKLKGWLIFFFVAVTVSLWLAVTASGIEPLPDLSVTVESYTYGSERSEPLVSGNIEGGRVSYYLRRHTDGGIGVWREITARPVSGGMPTEGGRYELKISVAPTVGYSGGSAICEFYVYPTDLEVKLSIKEKVYFGDDCGEGELFELSDLVGRDYTVEYAVRGSESFSSEAPVGVGKYTVRIRVRATQNYNASEQRGDFEIVKRPISDELELSDTVLVYGDTVSASFEPMYVGGSKRVSDELSTVSKTVDFRLLGSGGGYSTERPEKVGEYEVRVRIAESTNMLGGEVSAVLRIDKAPIYPELILKGWTFGESPGEPLLADGSNPGGGRVSFSYKIEVGEYVEGMPNDAGHYTVRATVAESECYMSGECFAEVEIEKAEREGLQLHFKGWTYGEKPPTPIVDGLWSDDRVSLYYLKRESGERTDDPPTESGEYTLCAVVDESKNYREKRLTIEFTVEKAAISPSVFMDDWVYGNEPSHLGISGNAEGAEPFISYYRKKNGTYTLLSESELVNGKPYTAGSYRVVCEIPEGKNHKGVSVYCEFTVERATPSVSVSMGDYVFYGKPSIPKVDGNPEKGVVTYIYYPKGGDPTLGSADMTEVICLPGEYTVTAFVSGTENYTSASASADFTVMKADLPSSSMSLTVRVDGKTVSKIEFGSNYELSLKNNVGYGHVSYSFMSEGGEYSELRPTAVGKYRVKAEIEATDIYRTLTLYFEIEIVKVSRGELTLSYGEAVYGGEKPSAIISGNLDEADDNKMHFSHRPYGDTDSRYITGLPTNAGRYDIRLEIAETENYSASTVYGELTIDKAPSVITAEDTAVEYNGTPVKLPVALNHSESVLTVVGDGEVDVGEYLVTVSVPESDNYLGAEITVKLTVVKARGEIYDVVLSDKHYDGDPVNGPEYKVRGDGSVTVEYYSNERLLDGPPIQLGEYTVRITLAEGKNYTGCISEHTVRITSAAIPILPPDGDGEGTTWIYLTVILLILLCIAALLIFMLLRRRRDGGEVALLPNGHGLPSSEEKNDGEEGNGELMTDNMTAGGNDADVTAAEADRINDRGRIELDMWNQSEMYGEAFVPDAEVEDSGIVYRKGGRCAEINLDTLCRHFDDGDVVDLEALKRKGLIAKGCKRVKLLGRGEMTKRLEIRLDSYSKRAMESVNSSK